MVIYGQESDGMGNALARLMIELLVLAANAYTHYFEDSIGLIPW